MHYAHSTTNPDRTNWQLLDDHLEGVAKLSATFGKRFGLGPAARLCGLLHDEGKRTPAFQARLRGEKGKVDHSTAGAKIALSLPAASADRVGCELIAYAIAGHHGGLPDRTGQGSLTERVRRTIELPDRSRASRIALEVTSLIPPFEWRKDGRGAFQLGFLGRMLFSCLVDADFLDTQSLYDRVEGRSRDRAWPALPSIVEALLAAFDAQMAALTRDADGPIDALRAQILAEVRGKAALAPGVFTLTVPTGGGKTLASLGFALDHARQHGLERIIYAIPFTSVIDQTVAVFRDVLGTEHVLEHHSAVEFASAADEERYQDAHATSSLEEKLRMAMEDWAAPVVVTTNVQLFESLFANRPGRCRKLHNIARSVLILDEAQTIPRPLLRPCVAALDELARNYGVSVVLCTATQPALAASEFRGGLEIEPGYELAPDPAGLARRLRRTRIGLAGAMSDVELVAELARHPQALVIVNTRAHALALYRACRAGGLAGLMHLTTRQHAADRLRHLRSLRTRLRDGAPCWLVATSLVEAGVDLDFPRVWRAEAGLDQIAQAAGRCNREGLRPMDDSVVTVFRAPGNPPPREIEDLIKAFERMRDKHPDLLSPEAVREYFSEVYWRIGEGLDRHDILNRFKFNTRNREVHAEYRKVAELFRMIDSGLAPVIVAGEAEARRELAKLAGDKVSAGAVARELQPFVVQVPPRARALLIANGRVSFERPERFGDQFAVLRDEGLYCDDVGLLWEDAGYLSIEAAMI